MLDGDQSISEQKYFFKSHVKRQLNRVIITDNSNIEIASPGVGGEEAAQWKAMKAELAW